MSASFGATAAVGASAGRDGGPPMPRMSKVELFAAIRRDSRAGMSGRAIATKYRVSRHTVSDALASAPMLVLWISGSPEPTE